MEIKYKRSFIYLIGIILAVLFGPLIFLIVFLLVDNISGHTSGSGLIPANIQNNKHLKFWSFFFDKPKDSDTKQIFRFCLVQLPIVTVIFGLVFYASVIWTQFVFTNLFGVDFIKFLGNFLG